MPRPKTKAGANNETKDNCKKPRIRKTTGETENSVIGKEVNGIVDGSFDAGYLLTVKVEGSPLVLRGLVFEPGLSVPLSTANDVAPTVGTLVHDENVFLPKQTQPSGRVLPPLSELAPSTMVEHSKDPPQNPDPAVASNADKGQESSSMQKDKEHMREKNQATTIEKECRESDVVIGSHQKECSAEADAGKEMGTDVVTGHKEMGAGARSPRKVSAASDEMGRESPVAEAKHSAATTSQGAAETQTIDMKMNTNVGQSVSQEQQKAAPGVATEAENTDMTSSPHVTVEPENTDMDAVDAKVGECVLREQKATAMVASEEPKEAAALGGPEDNDVTNSDFATETARGATEQEFIDVWQLNPGERCLEDRERELMNVVEAQLCGLDTTGAECTWTKSFTDGVEVSGNVSEADEQPNDSLFG